MSTTTGAVSSVSERTGFERLRAYNLIVGLILLAQVIVLLILSNDFSLPVTTSYLSGPPGSGFGENELAFSLRIGPVVALFLFISTVDHLLMATPRIYSWYTANLSRGINYARWWDYAFSSSVMIVLIAMLSGTTNLNTLILIFAVNATMILFGLMMELHNLSTERTNWTSFLFGCFAGAVPWVVIAISIIGAESDGDVPNFVYGIFFSLFIFFNSFAVNMFLQYKQVGPWRDYLFGEKAYILLSLTAKAALAWQVFTSTLMD